MEEMSLDLSPKQLRALKGGKTIQLKPAMMGTGMKVKMAAGKAKKMRSAMKHNKGMRLSMSGDEIQAFDGVTPPSPTPAVMAAAGAIIMDPVPKPKKCSKFGLCVAGGAAKKKMPAKKSSSGGQVKMGAVSMCPVRYNTKMTSPGLPAANPLTDVGSLYYGTEFVKGVGVGMPVLASKHGM